VGVALLLVVVGLTGLGYGIWHSYQNPWQISTSKEGEYVVEFPGRPEVTTRPHTHALGSTTIHLQGTTTDDRTQSYTVGYVDLPEEWLKKSSKNEVLNDALIWVTKGHGNVNEKSRKDIWHGKWPGRELATVVGDDGGGLIARAFLVERRIYVVYVSWLYSKDVPDKASRFMDSFQVLRFSVLQK